MITVNSKTYIQGISKWDFRFKGKQADTKPLVEYGGDLIADNSIFLELDTANFYYYEGTDTVLVAEREYDHFVKPEGENFYLSLLLQTVVSDDTIEVNFDGTKYLCHKQVLGEGEWIYGSDWNNGHPTFADYPFILYFKPSDIDVARAIAKLTNSPVTMTVTKPSGEWHMVGVVED